MIPCGNCSWSYGPRARRRGSTRTSPPSAANSIASCPPSKRTWNMAQRELGAEDADVLRLVISPALSLSKDWACPGSSLRSAKPPVGSSRVACYAVAGLVRASIHGATGSSFIGSSLLVAARHLLRRAAASPAHASVPNTLMPGGITFEWILSDRGCSRMWRSFNGKFGWRWAGIDRAGIPVQPGPSYLSMALREGDLVLPQTP